MKKSTQRERPVDAAAVIFVVDDIPELGEMLQVVLTDAGYPTRVFCDPVRALEEMRGASPKPLLLVSDFRMPGINGLELIHRCKLCHPSIKIISASAHMIHEEIEKYPVRPDRILAKPYSTAQLLEMVKELLGN
jgi:two-component system nitrogen regulation response regulator GlnG